MDRKELRRKTWDTALFRGPNKERMLEKKYKGEGRDVRGKLDGDKERRIFQEVSG